MYSIVKQNSRKSMNILKINVIKNTDVTLTQREKLWNNRHCM